MRANCWVSARGASAQEIGASPLPLAARLTRRYTFDSRANRENPDAELCRIDANGGRSCIKVRLLIMHRGACLPISGRRYQADKDMMLMVSYSCTVRHCSRACNRSVCPVSAPNP